MQSASAACIFLWTRARLFAEARPSDTNRFSGEQIAGKRDFAIIFSRAALQIDCATGYQSRNRNNEVMINGE